MKAADLSNIFKSCQTSLSNADREIKLVLTDSRTLTDASRTLFFAIPTKRNNGSRYVSELYSQGVRDFVIPADLEISMLTAIESLPDVNLWRVPDVVAALQQLVAYHRGLFDIPVVGITGSNGKTIVKDWIAQMLAPDHHLAVSPRSYNSQIGVPLSVWQLAPEHDMAIFEAGVSEPNEMYRLQKVIQPTIGIFTNIGQAHDENFLTRTQKIAEKLHLFTHCQTLIYCSDHKDIHMLLSQQESFREVRRFTWGSGPDNAVRLLSVETGDKCTHLSVCHQDRDHLVTIPFVDRASVENAMHCITMLFFLGYDADEIARRCATLTPVAMRLEMNEGINNSLLINDSYSLDLNSLSIALDFLQHDSQHYKKTLVMSDFVQSGLLDSELYGQVSALLAQRGITKFIGIGPALLINRDFFGDIPDTAFFSSTEEFLHHQDFEDFKNETILLKGARKFGFEAIAKALQRKSHETIMEVNLAALVHNLNYYRSRIKPSTKLMAMVKASSYGAGKVEVANTLQFNHVDYLTVAYSDEGVELRRNGITVPIMVMNPEEESFEDIVRYHLEPDIYSFRIFDAFSEVARLFLKQGEKIPVHVELDTGMHRLGFSGADISGIVERFSHPNSVLSVKSLFSHLACSEDPEMDHFTNAQIDKFRNWCGQLKAALHNDDICCHILNSSGITRFPEAQMDMVRLGIGLYGIAPEPSVQAHLLPVSRLKTRISQLKEIPQGDSVGYNRRWVAQRPSRIAILPIGYADGLSRHLGCENGKVLVSGCEAPIIGSICMDMCFVDVTDLPCHEGDEVTIFGDASLLQKISTAAGTIPYEILTSVSPRVKRVYFQE